MRGMREDVVSRREDWRVDEAVTARDRAVEVDTEPDHDEVCDGTLPCRECRRLERMREVTR